MGTSQAQLPGYRETEYPDALCAGRLAALRPYIRQSGNDVRGCWLLKNRKLLDYLLVFIVKGRGIFTVDGEQFDVNDNDLIWIPPDTEHEMSGTSETMHCLYLHFDLVYDRQRSHWDACIPGGTLDLSSWKQYLHPPVNDPAINSLKGKIQVNNSAEIRILLEKMCKEHQQYPAKEALLLSGMLLELIALILRGQETGGQPGSLHSRKLQAAAAYIFNNINGELDAGKMATKFGFSLSHFRKLFREVNGVCPRTLHRTARINRAAELLVYSQKTVSEIADELGFSTIHSFSRAFRDVIKLSPRQYRAGGKQR
ncbi:MAG: helix-turn-helix domain-containing protein [Victivallaceae bacterium]